LNKNVKNQTKPTADSKKDLKSEQKTGKQVDSEDEPSTEVDEKEAETSSSGCPVMSQPKSLNPDLELLESGHDLPYVSRFNSLFGFKGVFDMMPGLEIKRDIWDEYPIYLKNTLFYTGTNYDKIREMEIGHIFFVVDKLRERGNKRFRKGHYKKALCHYEEAMSLMRWLDCNVDMNSQPFDSQPWMEKLQNPEKFDDNLSELSQEIATKFKAVSDTESMADNTDSQKKPDTDSQTKASDGDSGIDDEWLKSRKNRLYMTTFHDDNIVYHNGKDMKDKEAIEMRKGQLFI